MNLSDIDCDLGKVEGLSQEEVRRLLLRLSVLQGALCSRLDVFNGSHHEGPQLYGVQEAADRLDMSRDYLYRNSDTLPFSLHVGDRVMFDRKGMEDWIEIQRRSK